MLVPTEDQETHLTLTKATSVNDVLKAKWPTKNIGKSVFHE